MKTLYSVLFAIALALGITPANAQKISALPDAGLAQAGDLFPISNLGRSATTSFTVTAQNLLQSGLPASLATITSSAVVFAPRFVASSGTSTFAQNLSVGSGANLLLLDGINTVQAYTLQGSGGSLRTLNSSGAAWLPSSALSYWIASTGTFGFGTTTNPETRDGGFSRLAAASIGVGDGTVAATNGAMVMAGITVGSSVTMGKTVTATGTTGARTINLPTGAVNFAAAATSLVVTNSLATVNSIIQCTVGTNDTTMKSVQCVAAAGSFTIFANAAATAETRVNFTLTN